MAYRQEISGPDPLQCEAGAEGEELMDDLEKLVYSIWNFNSETGEWPEFNERVGLLIQKYIKTQIGNDRKKTLYNIDELFVKQAIAEVWNRTKDYWPYGE